MKLERSGFILSHMKTTTNIDMTYAAERVATLFDDPETIRRVYQGALDSALADPCDLDTEAGRAAMRAERDEAIAYFTARLAAIA